VDRDPELERFKSEIHFLQYAGTCGYAVDRRESSRSSVVMRHAGTGDKIVVTRHDDEHWLYFSVRDAADNGTIIDFVQRRRRLSLGHVRRELRAWMGGPPAPPPDLHVGDVRAIRRDRFEVIAEFAAADLADDSAYLNRRGLRPETLGDPRFAGTFAVDRRGNVLFPHHDEDGEVCGFEVKNRGFTGFSKGGQKTVWSSSTMLADRRLVLLESAIDALSYHQLNPSADTRYISIGGEPSAKGREAIARAIRQMSAGATVVLAFDRDDGGDRLTTIVEALVPRPMVRELPPSPPGARGKDWNDYVQIVERRYIEALPPLGEPRP
jgi:hypothetical protein